MILLFLFIGLATAHLRSQVVESLNAYEIVLATTSIPHTLLSVSDRTQQTNHPSSFTVSLHTFGNDYDLVLSRYDDFFHPKYQELIINKEGRIDETRYREYGQVQTDCYYKGKVSGAEIAESELMVNTCTGKGLMGWFGVKKEGSEWESFGIEPASQHLDKHVLQSRSSQPSTHSTQYVIFRHDALQSANEPGICGVDEHFMLRQKAFASASLQTRTSKPSASSISPATQKKNLQSVSSSTIQSSHHTHIAHGLSPHSHPQYNLLDTGNLTKWVEYMVFNDFANFQAYGENVQSMSNTIAGYVHAIYQQPGAQNFKYKINIRLVAQATFSSGDPYPEPDIEPSGDPILISHNQISVLERFTLWRYINLNRLPPHDNAGLYTGYKLVGQNLGLGWVGGMCEEVQGSTAHIASMRSHDLKRKAIIAAHEMGHNFGARHDDEIVPPAGYELPAINQTFRINSCKNPGPFIMTAVLTTPPTDWSPCSKIFVDAFFDGGSDQGSYVNNTMCLENVPNATSIWIDGPFCGDGLLQGDEECDCGFTNCSATDPCCNGTTCKLHPDAECSEIYGIYGCCKDCKIRAREDKYICRNSTDLTCDFPEYCDGSSGYCPSDIFANAGVSCISRTNSSGTCQGGLCVSADYQCLMLAYQLYLYFQTTPTTDCYNATAPCGPMSCQIASSSSGKSCQLNVDIGEGIIQTIDGYPCKANQQCYNGSCLNYRDVPLPIYSYSWYASGFGNCSALCDGGIQTQLVECRTNTSRRVPDSKCTGSKPPETLPCNTNTCKHWEIGNWSTCDSGLCVGDHNRTVECWTDELLDDSNCTAVGLIKPSTIEACCDWVTENPQTCSASCDGGTRNRSVVCRTTYSPFDQQQDALCNQSTIPSVSETCNTQACYYWNTTITPCTKICGTGSQVESSTCYSYTGQAVPDQSCSPVGPKPQTQTLVCNDFLCPKYEWVNTSEWTNCSQACGDAGKQTITFKCQETEYDPAVTNAVCVVGGQNVDCRITPILDEDCPVQKPPTSRACNVRNCKYWRIPDWSNCSVDLCNGNQNRNVTCWTWDTVEELPDDNCTSLGLTKPPVTQNCSCDWITTNPTNCSKPCDGGISNRTVLCRQNMSPFTDAPNALCNQSTQPQDSVPCNTQKCFVWNTTRTDCTKPCAAGTQIESTVCYNGSTVDDSFCINYGLGAKPQTQTLVCNDFDCPIYKWVNSTSWSNCSKDCGSGIQNLTYVCQQTVFFPNVTNTTVANSMCVANELPPNARQCNTQQCNYYSWYLSPWTPNPCTPDPCITSTPVYQTRVTACLSLDGTQVSTTLCPNSSFPTSLLCACGVGYLSVYEPESAQLVVPGSKVWIRWWSLGIGDYVSILYQRVSWTYSLYIARSIANSGLLLWNVPSDLLAGAYTIRVQVSPDKGATSQLFSVQNPCLDQFCYRGECSNTTGECECYDPWDGATCSNNTCLGIQCGNGTCSRGGCVCYPGYGGSNCQYVNCNLNCTQTWARGVAKPDCSACDCPGYWSGARCLTCNLPCQHGGVPHSSCTYCVCNASDWFDGDFCENEYVIVQVKLANRTVDSNLHSTNPDEWRRFNNSLSQDLSYMLGTPTYTVEYSASSAQDPSIIQFRFIDDPITGVTGLTLAQRFIAIFDNPANRSAMLAGDVTGRFDTSVEPQISVKPVEAQPTPTPTKDGSSFPTSAAGWFQGTWLIYSIVMIIIAAFLLGICLFVIIRNCVKKPNKELIRGSESKAAMGSEDVELDGQMAAS